MSRCRHRRSIGNSSPPRTRTTSRRRVGVNRLDWTPLLEAIILGGGDEAHTEVVRQLVEAGVDVNLAHGEGVTVCC